MRIRKDVWKLVGIDPNDAASADAFNDAYSDACKLLGIPRDQMLVTPAQAARYLGVSERTAIRYAYAEPTFIRRELVGRRMVMVMDDVVLYKMHRRSKTV